MKFRPHLPIAFGIAFFHFCFAFIAAMFAAGQADSQGQPHGYGWIILAHVFMFPVGAAYELLSNLTGKDFNLENVLPVAFFLQSICWGLILSAIYRRAFVKDKTAPLAAS